MSTFSFLNAQTSFINCVNLFVEIVSHIKCLGGTKKKAKGRNNRELFECPWRQTCTYNVLEFTGRNICLQETREIKGLKRADQEISSSADCFFF